MQVIVRATLAQDNMSKKCFIAWLNTTAPTERSDPTPSVPPRCLCSPHPSFLRRKVARALLHEAAGIFFTGTAHGEPVHFNGRDAHAYRDSLPIFAAGAYAFVEFQIVADHRDMRQHIRAIADQRSALDRRGDVAVFNQVSFGG